jgi:pyridoxine/pyridoxamine 5'-phosphate oxidase
VNAYEVRIIGGILTVFLRWLDAAIATGQHEPHAMTLSTVDEGGHPDARVLLFKDVDAEGWHLQARLAAEPDLVAPGWTAYVVAAQEVEERRNWRLKYARDTDGWSRTLLWP